MSKFTLVSLVFLVFHLNPQLSDVGARMSDDMMIQKPDFWESQIHAQPDGNENQGRRLHLVHQLEKTLNRLPGVCKRIRRRRIRILCNVEKYCSMKPGDKHRQICPCPPGSRCGHFFLKSL